MSALELLLFLSVFGVPATGALYFSQTRNVQESLALFFSPFIVGAGAFSLLLAATLLVTHPEISSAYQILPGLTPAGDFSAALRLSADRIVWFFGFGLFLLVLAICFYADKLTTSWKPSRYYYFLGLGPIGALVIFSQSLYVSLVSAEIFILLLYFFDREESSALLPLRDRGVLRRAMFLIISFLLVAAGSVLLGLEMPAIWSFISVIYILSYGYSILSLRTWTEMATLLIKIYIAIYLVGQFGAFTSTTPPSLVTGAVYLMFATAHGIFSTSSKKFINVLSHVLLSGLGLFLAAMTMGFSGADGATVLSEKIFLTLLLLFGLMGFQLNFRPSSRKRVAIYLIIFIGMAPALAGLPSFLHEVTQMGSAEKLYFAAYSAALTFFGFSLGRLSLLALGLGQRSGMQRKWNLKEDHSELLVGVLLILLFLLVWSSLEIQGVSFFSMSLVSVWTALVLALYVGGLTMGFFLSRSSEFAWLENNYRRLLDAEFAGEKVFILDRMSAFGAWLGGTKDRVLTVWGARILAAVRATLLLEERLLCRSVWEETRAYLFSGSLLLRLVHTGLLRSFWFWGLLVWIFAGVFFGPR